MSATTPTGYKLAFSNLKGSVSAANYMGLISLTSYDVLTCQSKCDQTTGCVAFNVYAERDPSLAPDAAKCPNPPSTTNFVCTLWGVPICDDEATNSGKQQRFREPTKY
jgi:hypothetical protein